MPDVSVTIADDAATGVIVVSFSGHLDLTTVPTVRMALLKCLARAPAAVIVDVTRLTFGATTNLAVFPSAARAHKAANVSFSLVGARSTRELDRTASVVLRGVADFATRGQALDAVVHRRLDTIRRTDLTLALTDTTSQRAESMVANVCLAWDIEAIRDAAIVVVGVLVGGAVRRASGSVRVSAAFPGRFLHLGVHDYSPAETNLVELTEDADALSMVEFYATAWGCRRSGSRRTAWATLRATW